MISLVEVRKSGVFLESGFTIREVLVNPEHIVLVEEDEEAKKQFKKILEEDTSRAKGLEKQTSFSKITMNNGAILMVIGTVSQVRQRISTGKSVLKG